MIHTGLNQFMMVTIAHGIRVIENLPITLLLEHDYLNAVKYTLQHCQLYLILIMIAINLIFTQSLAIQVV